MVKDIDCAVITSSNDYTIVFPKHHLFWVSLRRLSCWEAMYVGSCLQMVSREPFTIIDDHQLFLMANCGMPTCSV